MFCKTTYCALVLMMEVALVYDTENSIGIDFVSRKHSIPLDLFDDILKKLNDNNLIIVLDGKLHLRSSPDNITIWQIVCGVSGNNIFTGRYLDESKQVPPTSTLIMLHRERESVLKMIENRLRREKLSVWSTRANKTIYI